MFYRVKLLIAQTIRTKRQTLSSKLSALQKVTFYPDTTEYVFSDEEVGHVLKVKLCPNYPCIWKFAFTPPTTCSRRKKRKKFSPKLFLGINHTHSEI